MLEGDITFDNIVEKTKRMLGKNYRGDTELVPAYSSFIPIEGHTDAFLTISNNNFSNEDIETIEKITNNYSWYVANKGYLMDNSQSAISALIIYGSEEGSTPPDVLNFNGVTENSFYLPINRTDVEGNINNSNNHFYVQYEIDEETLTIETDMDGLGDGTITDLDGNTYTMYAGRLYDEDKIVIDNNITYPIYLVSNLEYYYIPTVGEEGEAIEGSHDTEKVEQNNLEILEDVCELVLYEAAQYTNRPTGTLLMNDCWPIIVKCSCMAYLNRGAENMSSQTELGQQNNYQDWVSVLHKQIVNRRYLI